MFSESTYAQVSSSSSTSSSGGIIASSSGILTSSSSSSSSSSSGEIIIGNGSSSSSSSSGSSGSLPTISSSGGVIGAAYILTEGPHIGVQIYAGQNLISVTPDINPFTEAAGSIYNPEKVTNQMGCSSLHFHGMFFNKNDPRPRLCGWSKVVRLDSAPNDLRFISTAINSDFLALENIKFIEPNYTATSFYLNNSINSLQDLKATFPEEKNKPRAIKSLECAIQLDIKAKEIIDNVISDMKHVGDKLTVKNALRKALFCKRDLIKLLIRAEKQPKKNGKNK